MALRNLLEQRASTVQAMRAITESPAGDGGDLSDTQAQDFDRHKAALERTEAALGRQQALDDAERRMAAPAIVHGAGRDGRFEERAREFSLVRAINARIGEDVDAGFEREISGEVKRRSGRTFTGIAVPDEYFQVERRGPILTSAGAADLYPTVHRPDLFIDLLRDSLVTGRLGATVLDGLVGDTDVPRQTASSTAQWIGEDDALTETDPAFDDVELSPKTVGCMTSYSRRTLINAQPSIEAIVRRDLAAVIANAIDREALLGDGQSDKPTGVLNAGALALTLAGPTWAQVLTFISSIQTQNADVSSMAWVMNPNAVAKLRGTLRESGDAAGGYLMEGPGALAGFPVAVTAALPGTRGVSPASPATVLFGAWSQLLIGYWSATDVLANPFADSAYARGRVLIRAMRDCDVAVRHGASFAKATNLSVA